MIGSLTRRFVQVVALTIAIVVFAANLALADGFTADSDALNADGNLNISDCSVLPNTYTGRAVIKYNGSSHFANGASVTVTSTPQASAASAGITANGSTMTMPSPWDGNSPDQIGSITVRVPSGIANGTYKVDNSASGAKAGSGTLTLTDGYNVIINCTSTDTAAPTNVAITIDDGLDWTNSAAGSVTLDLSGNDDNGIASYRLATTQAGLGSATAVAVSPAQASWSALNVAYTLTGSEGTKTVWLRACDAANNCADASDTIGWDHTAPTGASVSIDNGASWTNDAEGDVVLDLAANDNIGVTSYRLAESSGGLGSATPVAVTSTTSYSAYDLAFQLSGAEGASKPVWFRACDAAGNCSNASDTIGWDHTAPSNASIVIDDGAAWTTDPEGDVTVDLSAIDGLGVTSYRLASSQAGLDSATPVAVASTTSFSASDVAFQLAGSEGASKPVWLRVCDAAGNCADASDTIGWDHTATTNAAIQINDGAAWTNDAEGDVTLDISGDDNIGIVSYRLAESQAGLAGATSHAVNPAESSFSRSDVAFQLSGSEGAAKQVWLRVCDGANNCVDVSDSIGWDHTAPSVAYLSATTDPNANGWYKNDVTATFRGTDNLSGFAPSGDFTKDATATTSGEGAAVTVGSPAFTDLAGNTTAAGNETSAAYKVDKTAPTVEYTSAAGTAGTNGWYVSDVVATFTATDNLSGFAPSGSLTKDDSSTTSGEGTAVTVGSPAFTDLAGNTVAAGAADSDPYMIDKTAPVVSVTGATTSANASGWYNHDVTVSFHAVDNLSGFDALGTLTADDTSTTSGEGTDRTASSPAFTDWAGNTTAAGDKTSAGFKVDKTAPTVAYTSAAGTSGLHGWYVSDVVATFTATDNLSGFAPSGDLTKDDTSTTSGEGAAVNVGSPAFTDLADNTVAAGATTSDPYKIDKTKPVVTVVGATTDPNANGWYKNDVTVTFHAFDAVSGFDDLGTNDTEDTSTTSGEGTDRTATSPSFTDWAGNTTPAGDKTSPAYKVDKTAPTVAYTSAAGTAGTNGWYVSNVVATFTANDNLSGFAPSGSLATTATSTTSGEGTVSVGSPAFTDLAGNSVAAGAAHSPDYMVDLSDPHDVQFIGGPAQGGVYYFGFVPGTPTCSAQDAISGMLSCVVTGYSSAVGGHTMTATATDNAGRTATANRSYTVSSWTLRGFYQPVDMNGVWNTVKNGSTVPLKWEMFAGPTELTDVGYVSSVTAAQVSCTSSGSEDAIEETAAATGQTVLRYDSTGGQYIYNWKTPNKAGSCYRVTMTALDGSKLSALFKLK